LELACALSNGAISSDLGQPYLFQTTPFLHFVSLSISLYWVVVKTSKNVSPWMANYPDRGVARSRQAFIFCRTSSISLERLKLELSNFIHR